MLTVDHLDEALNSEGETYSPHATRAASNVQKNSVDFYKLKDSVASLSRGLHLVYLFDL